jgi:hypothetical protein
VAAFQREKKESMATAMTLSTIITNMAMGAQEEAN